MSLPVLVLIDRAQALAAVYRERSLSANRKYETLRKSGGSRVEKCLAAHEEHVCGEIADALNEMVKP